MKKLDNRYLANGAEQMVKLISYFPLLDYIQFM